MRQQSTTVDQVLARIASAQHGVVTRKHLLHAGLTEGAIRQRLAAGALLVEHPGVYRVGHRAHSLEARYLAAVFACGDGALLTGPPAAHLLGVLKRSPPAPEVTAPTKRRVKGVTTRRLRIHPRERTTCRGIPVTSVPRTLVDLASVLSVDELARACHEAGVRYGTTPAAVEAVLARHPHTPGSKKLRQVLHGEVKVTLSKLESRFFQRLRDARLLLPPETNRPAGGHRVDCRWPEQRLTVELDGYRYHRSRHAWEQDRRREREARARGDDFRRYTYGDVFESPALMLAELQKRFCLRRDSVGERAGQRRHPPNACPASLSRRR